MKIQGGYLKFLPKSLGGSRLSGKIAWGGSPYFGFYWIFINKFFKNLPGGCCFIAPLCASMIISQKRGMLTQAFNHDRKRTFQRKCIRRRCSGSIFRMLTFDFSRSKRMIWRTVCKWEKEDKIWKNASQKCFETFFDCSRSFTIGCFKWKNKNLGISFICLLWINYSVKKFRMNWEREKTRHRV